MVLHYVHSYNVMTNFRYCLLCSFKPVTFDAARIDLEMPTFLDIH